MAKKWTLETARALVGRTCKIGDKMIKIGEGAGIKTFGAIDYLVKVEGFIVMK
jgi:hypothetical protein